MNKTTLSLSRAFCLYFAVVAIVFALLNLLREAAWLMPLEMAHFDLTTSALAKPELAKDLVLIAVTESELAEWGWPLPDGKLAEIVRTAANAGAAVIGVDIYRDNPVAPGTEDLERALSDPRVIAISKLGANGAVVIPPPSAVLENGRFGFSDIPIDFDGVARRTLLLVNTREGIALSFALKLAMAASNQHELLPWAEDPKTLLLGDTPVPSLIGDFGAYRRTSVAGYQILTSHKYQLPVAVSVTARSLLDNDFPKELFKGKIALIGLTSDSIKDHFITPLNRRTGANFAFGLQLHATNVQQLLDYFAGRQVPIRSPGRKIQMAMMLLASITGAAAAFWARSTIVVLLIGPGVALVLGIAMSYALAFNTWLPVVPVLLAWLASFTAFFTLIAVIARRQRRILSGLFSMHLSPELANEIWDNRKTILSGQKPIPRRLDVTVLMADIAGSTKIGAALEPREFMEWISGLLDEISLVAQAHGGFVEKYTGDGVLIVFGAPLPSETAAEHSNDACAACDCALAIRQAVSQLNKATDLSIPYRVRIGLNSGPVLGGTIGKPGSMQYNVVGDTVNVAARVETWSKTLINGQKQDVLICLTDRTVSLLRPEIVYRSVGYLTHDNKKDRFEIFELLDESRGEPS